MWLYEQLGDDLFLNVGSGGTDVCSGLVSAYPVLPVYAGEITAPCLGVDAVAFDLDGRPVVGELGELVIRAPDALDAGRLLERRRRLPVQRGLLRALPGRLAPRRLDPVHRARELRDHRPLRRDAQPRRRAPRDERAVRRRRGDGRGARQPRRPSRADRRPAPVRRAPRRRRPRRPARAAGSRTRSARASHPGTGRTRSTPCRRSRAR